MGLLVCLLALVSFLHILKGVAGASSWITLIAKGNQVKARGAGIHTGGFGHNAAAMRD